MSTCTKEPLNILNCSGAALRKTARAVTRPCDEALKPTARQFTMLTELCLGGNRPFGGLAGLLVMDRTMPSRNLRLLLTRGLTVLESEDDRLVRRDALTEAGRTAFEAALPH